MEYVKKTIAENLGIIDPNKLVPENEQFSLDAVPDLSGKVAVVTGGSEGIGYGCTHTLLSHNISKLFILSPKKEIIDGALEALRSEMGAGAANKVKWLQCDLSNWKQTADVAFQITQETDRLDILINNAARGIMTFQLADSNGIDLHMALNHMGHVVLTSHLLPLMKKTASSPGTTVRICNMASNAHQGAPKDTRFESVAELNTDLGPNPQYGRSKLAAILYSRYLARHLTAAHPNILANAVHPGVVKTRQSEELIHEAYPLGGYMMSIGMAPFKKDQFQGAVSMMYAATAIKESGCYVCPPAVKEPGSEMSQDEALGERLMKLTREVVMERTMGESKAKGCPFKDY